MTTNCFDVVSLFDLEKTKQATTTNAKTNRLKGPVVGVSMNVVVGVCVCVRQVENGFVASKGLKACSFVWLDKNIYENEAKM